MESSTVEELLSALRRRIEPGPDVASGEGPDEWADRAATIIERLQHFDDPVALDHAIHLLAKALRTIGVNHADSAMYLSNLGTALQMRFQTRGELGDLEQAVEVGQAAVAATAADDANEGAY